MDMSPACTAAPQPSANFKDRAHPKYNSWLKYRSSCAAQLVSATTFESWLDSIEMEEKRDAGLLPYQIVDAHPRGQEYWAYSREFHSKQRESGLPDWKQSRPLSFEDWLVKN